MSVRSSCVENREFLWETVHMSLKALHLSMSLQDDIAYPLKETDTDVFRPV